MPESGRAPPCGILSVTWFDLSRRRYAARSSFCLEYWTRMIPSSTDTGYVPTFTQTSGFNTSPVSSEIFQPCSGQTTLSPETMPSHRGPPRCGQELSTATYRSQIEDG